MDEMLVLLMVKVPKLLVFQCPSNSDGKLQTASEKLKIYNTGFINNAIY